MVSPYITMERPKGMNGVEVRLGTDAFGIIVRDGNAYLLPTEAAWLRDCINEWLNGQEVDILAPLSIRNPQAVELISIEAREPAHKGIVLGFQKDASFMFMSRMQAGELCRWLQCYLRNGYEQDIQEKSIIEPFGAEFNGFW